MAANRRGARFFLKDWSDARLSWGVRRVQRLAEPGGVRPAPEAEVAGETEKGPVAPLTLEVLFRTHIDDVYRFVRHQLGPAAEDGDIEDLVQKVFIAAGRGLSRFRGDSKPSTWLYRIASRMVLKHLDNRRRHRALLQRVEEGALTLEPVMSAEQRLLRQEELRLVWRCLMSIKPAKRMVLLLHRVEGRSGAEIADILQIKERTVWSRLHYARLELAQGLDRLRAQGVWDDR